MRISAEILAGLVDDVGAAYVSTQIPDKDAYSRDLWPRSQLDRLVGDPPTRPDAVVWPGDPDEVVSVVRRCAAAGVSIIPFGAGSGVCGATRPTEGGVVVDLKRLKRIRRIAPEAGVVEVEAGLMGERFERILEREGLTLGHFPSSILCSTVGGWLAGRSAGQCSSRYGKIEDMVVDLEVVTGDGVLRRTPATGTVGAGVDWNQVFVGSEGTLGIITAATLRVQPQPEARAFRGWMMPTVASGIELMRRTMQAGLRPAVIRLYDPLDTMMVGSDPNADHGGPVHRLKQALLGSSSGSGRGQALKQRGLRWVLGTPKVVNRVVDMLAENSLLVTVCEGNAAEARDSDEAIAEIARSLGAQDQGEAPGRAWLAHRYDVSYKMSKIYSAGAFVDTFEVATTWSRVKPLYDAVRRAVGQHVLVMAHFSHAYPGGCSIYFTLAGAGRDSAELRDIYDRAWKAGLDTTVAMDGTIAHHHGAGLSRRDHMPLVHGAAEAWFRGLKSTLDPAGILNPGKLFGEVKG